MSGFHKYVHVFFLKYLKKKSSKGFNTVQCVLNNAAYVQGPTHGLSGENMNTTSLSVVLALVAGLEESPAEESTPNQE